MRGPTIPGQVKAADRSLESSEARRSDQHGGFYYASSVVMKCPSWTPSGEVGKTFQRKSVNGATFLFLYIYIQISPEGTTDATPCRHAAVNDSSELNINLCCEQVPPRSTRTVTRLLE